MPPVIAGRLFLGDGGELAFGQPLADAVSGIGQSLRLRGVPAEGSPGSVNSSTRILRSSLGTRRLRNTPLMRSLIQARVLSTTPPRERRGRAT